MAKLNRDDHKVNDISAKIVKRLLIAGVTIGSILIGKKALDNRNSGEDADEDDDDTSC